MKLLMISTLIVAFATYGLVSMEPVQLKPTEPEERVILLATYAELHSDDPIAFLPPPVLD